MTGWAIYELVLAIALAIGGIWAVKYIFTTRRHGEIISIAIIGISIGLWNFEEIYMLSLIFAATALIGWIGVKIFGHSKDGKEEAIAAARKEAQIRAQQEAQARQAAWAKAHPYAGIGSSYSTNSSNSSSSSGSIWGNSNDSNPYDQLAKDRLEKLARIRSGLANNGDEGTWF